MFFHIADVSFNPRAPNVFCTLHVSFSDFSTQFAKMYRFLTYADTNLCNVKIYESRSPSAPLVGG